MRLRQACKIVRAFWTGANRRSATQSAAWRRYQRARFARERFALDAILAEGWPRA